LLSPNLPRIWSIENDPFDGRQGEYVLGVTLGDDSRAYPFDLVSGRGVTNDFIGDVPVLVVADPRDRSAHLFVRQIGEEPLEFVLEGGELRDVETGSLWSPLTGPWRYKASSVVRACDRYPSALHMTGLGRTSIRRPPSTGIEALGFLIPQSAQLCVEG
jgi:hypothetical protein